MYSQYTTAQVLIKRFQFVKDIGVLRKTLTYMNLFVFRLVSTHPVPAYSNLIGPEVKEFYRLSGRTS
jgi:hypothetical protein